MQKEGMSIGTEVVMEKNEKLWKMEGEKRPDGYLLTKSKEYSQELHQAFKFIAISYSLL